MQYLDPETIKKSDAVKERLKEFSGPSVRWGRTLEVVNKFSPRFFKDRDIKILDCGTASGRFIQDLYNAGYPNLYGIDIDDYLNNEAKQLLKEFKTVDLSYEKLPWPDNSFDILTAWCLVPHLENPHNFIREAYRALKDGGLLIFSSINVTSPPNKKYFLQHGDFPGYHERNNHIAILTPAVFKKTILRYFNLVGTEYFISPSTFQGWRGAIRRMIHAVCSYNEWLKIKLEERWGPKICYVLQKKQIS